MTRAPSLSLPSLLALALLAGCAGPPAAEEVDVWRARTHARPAGLIPVGTAALPLGSREVERERVDLLRQGGELDEARWRVLTLLERWPDDPELLWRASRAESDELVGLAARQAPRQERDLAAVSAERYARQARAVAGTSVGSDALGQLAWALGGTVHLQPMLSRGDQALEVQEAAQAALARQPDQHTAGAALATLHLRLATLPWIASLFAGDAPEGDLAQAERLARACLEGDPSLEHALLLARILCAQDRQAAALELLEGALVRPGYRPRDAELREVCRDLRDALREELGGGGAGAQ